MPDWERASSERSGVRLISQSGSPCRRAGACSVPWRWGIPTAKITARRHSSDHVRDQRSGCTEAAGDRCRQAYGPVRRPHLRLRQHVLGPLEPARHRPQQIGQPVEVVDDERVVQRVRPRPAARPGARSSGRGRARRQPGSPRDREVARHVEALEEVVDAGLEPGHHVAASPWSTPPRACGGSPGRWPPPPSARRGRGPGWSGARSASEPGAVSARATPMAAWASSTAPLSSIIATSPCAPGRRRAGPSSRRRLVLV